MCTRGWGAGLTDSDGLHILPGSDQFNSLLQISSSLQFQALFALLEKNPLKLEDGLDIFFRLDTERGFKVSATDLLEECSNFYNHTSHLAPGQGKGNRQARKSFGENLAPSLSLEILTDKKSISKRLALMSRGHDGVVTLDEWKELLAELLQKDLNFAIEKAWASGLVYFAHSCTDDSLGGLLLVDDHQAVANIPTPSPSRVLMQGKDYEGEKDDPSRTQDSGTPHSSVANSNGSSRPSNVVSLGAMRRPGSLLGGEVVNAEVAYDSEREDDHGHRPGRDGVSLWSKTRRRCSAAVVLLWERIWSRTAVDYLAQSSSSLRALLLSPFFLLKAALRASHLHNPAWQADFLYYEKNMNPIFGLFFCDPHHPISFLERLDIEFCVYGWVFFTSALFALTKQTREQKLGVQVEEGEQLREYEITNANKYIASFLLVTAPSMLLRVALFYMFLCPCVVVRRKKSNSLATRFAFPLLKLLGRAVGVATFLVSLCLYGCGLVLLMALTSRSRGRFLFYFSANWLLTNLVTYVVWDFCMYFNPFLCCAPPLATSNDSVAVSTRDGGGSALLSPLGTVMSAVVRVLRWAGMGQWQDERRRTQKKLRLCGAGAGRGRNGDVDRESCDISKSSGVDASCSKVVTASSSSFSASSGNGDNGSGSGSSSDSGGTNTTTGDSRGGVESGASCQSAGQGLSKKIQ